nr:VWA-like domain-containing protein [Clostridia bacterium]
MGKIQKREKPLSPEEQAKKEREAELRENARHVALQILNLTRNGLFVSLRFLDVALTQFEYMASSDIKNIATSGMHLIFDPRYVIEAYMKDKQALARDYLHIVLHCIFRHPFVSSNLNREYWDLAADIAVEGVICDMDIRQVKTKEAEAIAEEIQKIRSRVHSLTAEHIYNYLRTEEVSSRDLERWKKLFTRDDHGIWWEIAGEIEAEMKRRAEEAEKEEKQSRQEQEQEKKGRKAEEEQEQKEEPEEEESPEEEENGEQDQEPEGEDSGESEEQGEEPEDLEEGGDEYDGDDEPPEEESEEAEKSPEEEEDYEPPEDETPSQDEYEDEWTQDPGEGGPEAPEDEFGDEGTGEEGEESSGDGSGGGNPGEDPEESEEEGEGSGGSPSEGMEGSGDGSGDEDDAPPEDSMSGQSGTGHVDEDQDDSYGDEQQGGSDPSGNAQQQKGTNRGGSQQHTAGTGGGGDATQSAWEHSSGENTREGGGERDPENRREMEGTPDLNSDLEEASGDQKREMAEAEQGTGENTPEDDDSEPTYMHNGEVQKELEEKWKDISERLMVDLETSSKEWGDKSDSMMLGLKKVNRDKYDYRTFLQKFATLKEDMQINDDEFDYIYYTYGMDHYGNIPLIEPLEYKEVKKVRDFVIAIDTSGSCAGEVVQKFLDKTYSIFAQQENFFRKINLHIIQCDAQIQSDVKITNKTEFDDYIRDLKFVGFGGTDFRPVFQYVNEMIENREFDDLKGLIYFTDGNGTYPKRRPPYETAFVFVDDDEFDYQVPSWAMKLVLE